MPGSGSGGWQRGHPGKPLTPLATEQSDCSTCGRIIPHSFHTLCSEAKWLQDGFWQRTLLFSITHALGRWEAKVFHQTRSDSETSRAGRSQTTPSSPSEGASLKGRVQLLLFSLNLREVYDSGRGRHCVLMEERSAGTWTHSLGLTVQASKKVPQAEGCTAVCLRQALTLGTNQ